MSDKTQISGRLIAAARALIGISQAEFSPAAGNSRLKRCG